MARDDRSGRRTSLRDRVRERAESNKFTGGSSYIRLPEGVQFLKAKKGTMDLDIIPYEVSIDGVVPDGKTKEIVHRKGDLEYARTIFVHRNIGAEGKPYLCLRTIKKPCPICEERARLMKLENADEETISDLKPQVKDLFNVIDLGDKDTGIQVFEFSHANFREKLENEIREGDEDWAAFADLEEGYTVRTRFAEETFSNNKYFAADRIDFVKRKSYPDKILDEVVDLDACLVVLPYDKLKAIFWEADIDDSGDRGGDQDEPERSSRRQEPEPEREREHKHSERQEPEPERNERSSRRQEPARSEPERNEPARSEPERSSRRSEPEAKNEGSSGDSKCPFKHEFGKDCDDTNDCHNCPTEKWEPCRDEKDRLNPPRRTR